MNSDDIKNENEKDLFDKNLLVDTSVSEIISEAFDNMQISEIGKIEWFTINQAKEKIRPYNIEKKEVLDKVLKLLVSNNY